MTDTLKNKHHLNVEDELNWYFIYRWVVYNNASYCIGLIYNAFLSKLLIGKVNSNHSYRSVKDASIQLFVS